MSTDVRFIAIRKRDFGVQGDPNLENLGNFFAGGMWIHPALITDVLEDRSDV